MRGRFEPAGVPPTRGPDRTEDNILELQLFIRVQQMRGTARTGSAFLFLNIGPTIRL